MMPLHTIWTVNVNAFEPAPFTVTIQFAIKRERLHIPDVITHLYEKTYEGVEIPMMTIEPQTPVFTWDTFSKTWHIIFGPPEEPFLEDWVTVSVPPFNGGWTDQYNADHQVHELLEAPPPPPQPAPLPPSPVPIEPPAGPPTERPLEPEKPEPPITPEPPKPIPPDHPPSGRMSIDAHIWNKFIARFGDRITRWGLEVPLDDGDIHELKDIPPQYRAMWQRLTQHKADAVIEFNRVVYVCEIKPRLTLAALGQAYFGWQLFMQRYRVGKPCKPAVICETAPTSLLQIAAQNGITVFVVEEITPSAGVREWIE